MIARHLFGKSTPKRLLVTGMIVVGGAFFLLLYLLGFYRPDDPERRANQVIRGNSVLAGAGTASSRSPDSETSKKLGVRERLEQDIKASRPIVVHLIVALCDNKYQGIVPVPEKLGDGRDLRNNLYWGAMYGVRTFLTRKGNWELVAELSHSEPVLGKIVLHTVVHRSQQEVSVYIVAEAWDGKYIQAATKRFLAIAAGYKSEVIRIKTDKSVKEIHAGGQAHLVGYVGHNGLMDFSLEDTPGRHADAKPSSSLVLACKSKPYFHELLKKAGSHPLLLTTGLMAPEAYTLDAAIRSWAGGGRPEQVRDKAASAYHKYQKCGLMGAQRLFFYEPYGEKQQ
ncbi:MAG: hypothetical protein ACYSWP_00560 [Planctomycetota bacterium]|jgi:hypothetical protein